MHDVAGIAESLGCEIKDIDEEVFTLFCTAKTDNDLGIVDSKSSSVDISVAGLEFTLSQSPGILVSHRNEGTTGGAIWQTGVRMADWLLSRQSPLTSNARLSELLASFTVLELGCGISPLVALAVSDKVHHYIATDQQFILKRFRDNFDRNVRCSVSFSKGGSTRNAPISQRKVEVLPLDWEVHDIPKQLEQYLSTSQHFRDSSSGGSIDILIACDCVFNEHLIAPFVDACAAICTSHPGVLCVIGQQIRSPEIFEAWMLSMMSKFRLFYLKDVYQSEKISKSSGFIVYLAVLRNVYKHTMSAAATR